MTEPSFVTAPGADGRHATFCRICEAFCGLVATVEAGRITRLTPDHDKPHSKGHVCVKGIQMAQVVYDPDRVVTPLKRSGGPGEFEPVSWDEALDAIACRLSSIRIQHGDGAIASYLRNPTAFSTNAILGFGEFMSAIGSYKLYGAGSQDSNARMLANYFIHGAPFPAAMPDLARCDFLLIAGANPLVSNGWMICAPRLRHDLEAIARRGRVVVIDPRRTETAQAFDHVPIRPDTDVWLLLGMMRVIVDEGRYDQRWLDEIAVGCDELKSRVRLVSLTEAAARTGIALETMTELALSFATAKRAAIYGGLGLCRGRFGTLGAFLHSALNAITGRYGMPGGIRFGRKVLAGGAKPFAGVYGDLRTRVGGVPAIAGKMACAMLPADIEDEGPGRVRALVVSAGNPVITAPGAERLEAALEKLDLMVAFDLYQNETNRHAHYVLPTTTFLERADWPFVAFGALQQPFLQFTEAVVPPVGEAREDYEIYVDIVRRMEMDAPSALPERQTRARESLSTDPLRRVDAALRNGPLGDRYGAHPGGWSRERLRQWPHGVIVEDVPDDIHEWRSQLAHPDGRLHLWHDVLGGELDRLFAQADAPRGELTLIGRRDIRSINSWMHNIDKLVRSQAPTLLMHPDDAERRRVGDGDMVCVSNENGAFDARVELSGSIIPGVVSFPHGWGHRGGWRRANQTGVQNMNALLGLGVPSVEFVSGMTLIDCLPVSIARCDVAQVARVCMEG